jgi:Rrf2 family protein
MLISRECDYAIRIVRQLISGEKKRAEEICAAENVSVQFAYKILKKLEEGGLVNVYRGVQGGYSLAKEGNEITLYDIFIAMEDDLGISACLNQGYCCPMNTANNPCKVHCELEKIQSVMVDLMKEKTLTELFVSNNPE